MYVLCRYTLAKNLWGVQLCIVVFSGKDISVDISVLVYDVQHIVSLNGVKRIVTYILTHFRV